MSGEKSTERPVQFENLGPFCMMFRLKNLFISDNKSLFLVPRNDFCRFCFQRRYFTQTDGVRINQISDSALNLARKLDADFKNDGAWHLFSVIAQKLEKSFEFTPYEDCPVCGAQKTVNVSQAGAQYERLLNQETAPKLEALREQVFSFGFARSQVTTNTVSLANPELNKLLGNNYNANIIGRMVDANGRHVEECTLGLAPDKELAELKSLMEYIERYAFMLHSCRFKTNKCDDQIINRYLALYQDTVPETERNHIRSQAGWGINLATREISAIPLWFIFNKGQPGFIRPTTSGFGAHTDFRKSLCSSILELVERDACVRFWHDPQRAFNFEPDADVQSEVKNIVSVLKNILGNVDLRINYFVVQSPTRLPVVMVTISSQDFSKPPSLIHGCGVGFDLREALMGALKELRNCAINLVKAVTFFDGFLTRPFTTTRIEGIPDRMRFYSTCFPRPKLRFLDNVNPLVDGIVENVGQPGLDALIDRFRQIDFDIYGLDCTPGCFQDKSVYVTRAFSPQLYPLQFEQEDVFNLPAGPTSVHKELPHFFL